VKRLLLSFLSFIIVLSFNLTPAVGSEKYEKIDSAFLAESLHIQKRIPVIVELCDDPVAIYSLKKFEAENYFRDKNFKLDCLDKGYKFRLIESQNEFLLKMEKSYIDYKFRQRCTTAINAVLIDIFGEDISKLLKLPEVKRVYDDRFTF